MTPVSSDPNCPPAAVSDSPRDAALISLAKDGDFLLAMVKTALLDTLFAHAIRRELVPAVSEVRGVMIDVSAVGYADRIGIDAVFEAIASCPGKVCLIGRPAAIEQLLLMESLDQAIDRYDSIADARAALALVV